MSRTDFYMAVFEGTVEETAEYIKKNYSDCQWDCPTGRECVEGIIDMLSSGDDDVIIEIDGIGNIRCVGNLENFASIVEDD